MAINFAGFVYDESGAAISGLTVNLYDKNTTTPVRATDTTDANGKWSFAHASAGEFDVEIVNGAQKIRVKHDTSVQLEELTLADNNKIFLGSAPDASVYYDGADLVIKPNDAGSGDVVITGGSVELEDDESLTLGTGKDATILYDGVDLVINARAVGNGDVLISSDGILHVNDTSGNTNMTTGININQGGEDNDIFTLKSSDVAHAMTANKETDTYASMSKVAGASGGLQIETFTEDNEAFWLKATSTTDDTGKTATSDAVIVLDGYKKLSTGRSVVGSNANIVAIMNAEGTVFLFDAEGSAHADVEWTTFNKEDDLALIADLEREMLPDRFGQALTYSRESLEKLGIVGEGSWREGEGKQGAMVNFTRLSMLHHGALIQVGERLTGIEDGLKALNGD